MRILTAVACATLVSGLIAGCSEHQQTADPPTDEPAKALSKATSETPAVSQSAPRFTPSSALPSGSSSEPPIKPFFRRWAVICSKEVQEAGLGDLVTAELSKAEGLELVERDQLDAVTKELQLASALESQAAATRLKMGQLLKADALLALSVEGRESEKIRGLKVVVSECLCGARLRIEYLPYQAAAAANLSQRCGDIVAKVRKHFAGGIRQIVGVSPFLSKNLVHDYDFLQIVFARLLEAGLTATPRVAVIEIEEARAIGREGSLTGAAPLDRPTPLLVEGEYTVSPGGQGKPNVQFAFTCQGAGGQRRTVRPAAMPLSASARFIIGDLPPRLLTPKDGTPAGAVSPEEQSRWLIARGDAFSQVGAWEQGMELLEAAVLLSPDDFSLRLKLLSGYSRFLQSRSHWLSGRPKADVRAWVPAMIEAYLAYLGHVEYLIRNRRLNGCQAVAAVNSPYPFCVWPFYHDGATGGSSQSFRDLFQPVTEAEERFMAEVYPQVLLLPVGRAGENPEFTAIFHERSPFHGEDLQTLWLAGLIDWFVKEKASRIDLTPHDLDFLFRMLTEAAPDRCGTPKNLMQFLERPSAPRLPDGKRMPDAMTDTDWDAFLARLAASKHRMASFYGRYGQLYLKWSKYLVHLAPDLGQPLLPEVEAWLKDYAALDNRPKYPNGMDGDPLHDAVEQWRKGIVWQFNQPKQEVAVRRQQVTTPARQGTANKTPGLPAAAARLNFEEIELRGFQSNGFDGLMTLGDNCDALLRDDAIAIISKKEAAIEIRLAGTQFYNAYWDGRQIWMATSRQGIWVLSTGGSILTKIGPDQGLPPADRGMVLHVLGPGKVCAAGSFGEHRRAWCAMVELSQGGAKVKVFHQATHLPPSDTSFSKDVEQVFVPHRFYDYDPGNGGHPLLLLDRGLSTQVPLLAINPATLEVSELTTPPGTKLVPPGKRYTNRKGENVDMDRLQASIMQLLQPEATVAGGTAARRPRFPDLTKRAPMPGLEKVFLEYGGAIYIPGHGRDMGLMNVGGGRYVSRFDRADARWFRVDPETYHVEVLELGPSYPNMSCWYSVSNHYGLVGGCRAIGQLPARFFRVSVEELNKDAAAGPDVGPDELRPVQKGLVLFASSEASLGSIAKAAASQVETRTWTSLGGEFHVRARLVEAGKAAVVLEKEGGGRVTVPRAKLSQADLDYLSEQASAASPAKQPLAEP